MTFDPPSQTWRLTASDLPGVKEPPYLLKGFDDDDTAWNVVAQRPICRLVPNPERDAFLPPEVTVIFEDGTERLFNPDDQVLIGPTITGS